MKLEVHERFAIYQIIVEKMKANDIIGLRELRVARETVSFSPEEATFYEFKIDEKNTTTWNMEKAAQQVKDVPLTRYVTETIRAYLVEKNSKMLLLESQMSLYEKFVETYKP